MKENLILLFLILTIHSGTNAAWYIDDKAGNDKNPGNSPALAWKSIEKINETLLEPGDSVLFRRGGSWTGNLSPKGSGSEKLKIVFSAYGYGPLPVLNAMGKIAPGEDASYTIRFLNQEYFEISNLTIKNFKPFEEPESFTFRNNTVYANSVKMGIYVQGEDCGSLYGIEFLNLEICEINGSMNTKHNGGIFMEITRNNDPEKQVPSNFVNVLIQNCWIHDVDRTGFSNVSAWQNRTLHSRPGDILPGGKVHDWYPSKHIIIRNNRFQRTGANALIIRVAKAPLIEHNLFDHCSIKGSGNANFPFNCDDALFQYNEACYTYFNTEADSWNGRRDADAGGFDSDWKCKNTIIQYNYSHHNGYGGILICNNGGNAEGFNDGTIVRYNIFEDNQHHIVRTSGTVSNTMIYNNLFFSGDLSYPVMIVYHKSWGGYSDSTAYLNNIYYSVGKGNFFDTGKSTRNYFENNLYYGEIENRPEDPKGIYGDPLFTDGTRGGTAWKSWLGFLLREGSPALDAGREIEGAPQEDLRGMKISGKPELGPLEYHGNK